MSDPIGHTTLLADRRFLSKHRGPVPGVPQQNVFRLVFVLLQFCERNCLIHSWPIQSLQVASVCSMLQELAEFPFLKSELQPKHPLVHVCERSLLQCVLYCLCSCRVLTHLLYWLVPLELAVLPNRTAYCRHLKTVLHFR